MGFKDFVERKKQQYAEFSEKRRIHSERAEEKRQLMLDLRAKEATVRLATLKREHSNLKKIEAAKAYERKLRPKPQGFGSFNFNGGGDVLGDFLPKQRKGKKRRSNDLFGGL